MATLIFSTVGTILGGPIGGAIGALIGQSIDEQVLGPSSRGPRLGDLSVQTSAYGTQIPRVYGRMRVAGSVVWSTDLVQSEETSGAKGQPGVTYSYAVSFAVALSARRVASIGRIWADGKLLRGAEGDFKVPTQFRFYDGNEDQAVDPLIASVEGIDQTPAYRGLALAVFEGLELAEYGNRIPFLTFEVIADEEPPGVGAILADCSGGTIATDFAGSVEGYAGYGASIRAAAEPLIEAFAVPLFDDGEQVRAPLSNGAGAISEDGLGASLDGKAEPRFQRDQEPRHELPAVLRLGFYDPTRDYQSGEARAAAGDEGGREVRIELPAVIGADIAKGLAQHMLARRWARRERLTVLLPPEWLDLEPGSVVTLPLAPSEWAVDRVTIEGFAARLQLRPHLAGEPAAVPADSGAAASIPDVVESATVVALIDGPNFAESDASEPTLFLAASSASPGWGRKPVEIRRGTGVTLVATAPRKASIGLTLGPLGSGGPYVLDRLNSVDVALIDPDQWLTSCDDEALAEGANLAMIGGELIQFASAEPTGSGSFRLSRLLRGRLGTEDRSAGHAAGERFVLIERDSLVPVTVPAFALGASISAVPSRLGDAFETVVSSASIRPPSPVGLSANSDGSGGLAIGWIRRSRSGWAWLDEVDAPLGEAREAYRVTLSSLAGSIERIVFEPSAAFTAADLAPVGASPWTIGVRQLGDQAASVPATLILE